MRVVESLICKALQASLLAFTTNRILRHCFIHMYICFVLQWNSFLEWIMSSIYFIVKFVVEM